MKSLLFSLIAIGICFESSSFQLIIKSDSKIKNLQVIEYYGTGSNKLSNGINDISLENYPNAIYLYSQKWISNYQFLPMIWVESDTSTIQISIDENLNVTFEKESLCQIELNKIVQSTRNIHLGPFSYEPESDKPLEPILALEAKSMIQNLEVSTDLEVLKNLMRLSKERKIDNWATNVLATYLEEPQDKIYSEKKLVKVLGLDSLENLIEILPNSDDYLFVALSASWCGPCIKGLPKLRKTYDKVSDNISFVSLWNDPNLETFKYNHLDKKESINWTSLWDQYGFMANTLEIRAYPTYILFDPSGNEIDRWEGEWPKNLEEFAIQ